MFDDNVGFCEVDLANTFWTFMVDGTWVCDSCGLEQDYPPDGHMIEERF